MQSTLLFSQAYGQKNDSRRKRIKLLESEETILLSLEREHDVQFVSTTLCTPTETFVVTKVESSNSTLLMTGCLAEGKSLIIQSTSSFHWELRLTNPLLDFRRSLPSYGDHELSAARCAPNLKQLEASTQASPAEIARALQSSTVIIDQDGGHFYLQEAKLHQCLDQVLMTISLQGWPPSAIPLKACAEIAAKHSSDVTIAAYCLKRFSHSISSSGRVNLDVRRITCELAKSLFATKKAYASTSALMVDLCDCLPVRQSSELT